MSQADTDTETAPTDQPSGTGRADPEEGRAMRWLDSDLVGIPATLYTFGVLAVSLAVFRFGGPIAGIVVALGLWVPMVVFAIRGVGKRPGTLDIPAARGPHHRVLVIANEGLDDPALCGAVCARGKRADTEALVLAPVGGVSFMSDLADDVDKRLAEAGRRVDAAVQTLDAAGLKATGRATPADPMESVLDGLREFPPNEIVMMPGRERRWQAADELVERVRTEGGLPVTVLEPA